MGATGPLRQFFRMPTIENYKKKYLCLLKNSSSMAKLFCASHKSNLTCIKGYSSEALFIDPCLYYMSFVNRKPIFRALDLARLSYRDRASKLKFRYNTLQTAINKMLWSDCAYVQASLHLCCSQTLKMGFLKSRPIYPVFRQINKIIISEVQKNKIICQSLCLLILT